MGSRCFVFGRDTTRWKQRGPGGDDYGSVRANERGAERLDGLPVHLAIRREFREVVVKGGVDNAVRGRCSAAQALEILERTAMNVGPGRGKGCGGRIRARKANYLMSCADEFLNDGGADEARSASKEDTQMTNFFRVGDWKG